MLGQFDCSHLHYFSIVSKIRFVHYCFLYTYKYHTVFFYNKADEKTRLRLAYNKIIRLVNIPELINCFEVTGHLRVYRKNEVLFYGETLFIFHNKIY